MKSEEHVVLVDEYNNVLGTAAKSQVHGADTPLHRGFSCFIFNRDGKLLLQQRSHKKKTWPLVWSNSVCGHPALDESNVDAARRRLAFELGMEATTIEEVASYRYKFVRAGVMENEICPILIGFTDHEPKPNPEEVEAARWVDWRAFIEETKQPGCGYSEWCIEEAAILEKYRQSQISLLRTETAY